MLSPEEQAELAQLNKAAGAHPSQQGRLTASEAAELAELEKAASQPTSWAGKVGKAAAGIGQDVLRDVVIPAGRAIDSYTGAPIRAGIGALQDDALSPVQAAKAAWNQVGQDPDLAPSGKQIAQKAGVGETSLSEVVPFLYSETGEGLPLKKGGWADPTASGAAGLGIDIAADWTNVIPGAVIAKGAGKAAKGTALAGAHVAAKGTDLVTGTKAGTKVLETTKSGVNTVAKGVGALVNPKRVENWPEIVATAKKHGIDPELLAESIEFGPRSFISRASRHVAEGPAGEAALARHKKGLENIEDALSRQIDQVGGGRKFNEVEAGRLLREGYDQGVEKFFNGIDLTMNKVQEYAPGLHLDRDAAAALSSKLNGIEKYAKGLAKRGVDDVDAAQGKYLLRAIERIKAGNGSFKQTSEALQQIGRKAFPKNKTIIGQVPHDIEKMRELYFSTQDALLDTVRKHVNPDFADEIVANNAKISEFLSEKSVIAKPLATKDLADEKLFSTLLSDSRKVEALKQVMPPETIQQIKGAYLNNLVTRTKDGGVSFGRLANELRNNRPVLESLLTPAEIRSIEEIVSLGVEQGPAVLSSSGTGASNSFKDYLTGLATGVAGEGKLAAMKAKARGLPAPSAAPQQLTGGAGKIDKATLEYFAKRLAGKRDGRISQSAKVAQVASIKEDSGFDREFYEQKNKQRTPELKRTAASAAPAKGEAAWIARGAEKLGLTQEQADRLARDPKMKQLILQASDLPPGSARLGKLIDQLKKGGAYK